MKADIKCPEIEELRELLSGSLSTDRQQEYTEHLDSCSGCQVRIEEVATAGSNLSQVVEHLNQSEPVATSAYWPAMRALDPGLQPTITPHSSVRTRDLSLQFLEPASDSAYLGRLGHFDVMRVLGRGGMGVVLEAFDSRLQRNVALKVLDPELAGDEVARQRFCREARAAASITHENVVAVHQVEKSTDNGLPYLVMQLIAGESLEQRLQREQKLPYREIVRIGMQAAQGLAAAHAQGLIHRDIKPGNILLESGSDRVRLTDFGLARVTDDVKLTRTGFVSGTPLYMAPEQALGEEADHRSDLFSLGAILYEMCAGQPPFKGNSALAILKQIAEVKHRPLKEANPNVPEWLAGTIDRLLAKKPDQRIQTAAELAELFEFEWALMKATSEEVPQVCQVAARKRRIRNRWIALGVGVTFLALGLLGGQFIAERGDDAPAVAVVSEPEMKSSAEPVALLPATQGGTVWSLAFDPKGETLAMAPEDGAVRLWDWPTQSIKSTFTAHRGLIWSAQFSKNGEWFATAGDDGKIKLWNPLESDPVKTFDHGNAFRGLAFSHDDRSLFAGDRGGMLRIWPLDGDKPEVETQQPGAVYAIALSPNDSTLATGGSDKIVRLWNAKTLTPKLSLDGHTGQIFGLSFNQDGRRLASAGWDGTVRVWDVASGLLVKSWEAHKGDVWSIAYSPDGTKLATGGHDGAVKIWNSSTGELISTFLGHKVAVHIAAFSRDGTLLASGGRDGAIRVWKIE